MTKILDNIERLHCIDKKLQQSSTKLRTCNLTQLKLQAEKQYCKELLTDDLKMVYLERKVPQDLANKMATKAGIDTLIEKIPSKEAKTFLKWTEFSSITAATNKIVQNENNDDKNGSNKPPTRESK
ncbi:uncharacterized protein LOC118515154 [Anopheles stephensi]|uniref:uncharacterized protein LOC118515154 n=1 Tax=Anopheles stephensi TaxID=30069 RepID=UPI001658B3FD|nr:uncharacterized protein LOC118515154 [Anopheles stephensi]